MLVPHDSCSLTMNTLWLESEKLTISIKRSKLWECLLLSTASLLFHLLR